MCGRITLTTSGSELADYLRTIDSLTWEPRYNIAPTQPVATVRVESDGECHLREMRWGLIPHWADDPSIGNRMIDARAESLADKPAFRDAFRRGRCVVVADGFYEWQRLNGAKQPWYLFRSDGRPLTLAGLWDRWQPPDGEPVTSCTIVTTGPNELVENLHDRMPVILPEDAWDRWLDRDNREGAGLDELLRAYPADRMKAHPVSEHVNDPAHDDPECIRPLPRVKIRRPGEQGRLDL